MKTEPKHSPHTKPTTTSVGNANKTTKLDQNTLHPFSKHIKNPSHRAPFHDTQPPTCISMDSLPPPVSTELLDNGWSPIAEGVVEVHDGVDCAAAEAAAVDARERARASVRT